MRAGFGFDAHRLEPGRKFVLGGVHIESDRGAVGHSDADALAHAVSDAILGAAAIGDLGGRFPASDPRWKDADSLDLLARCAADVQRAGYSIQNVDATIVLESPRLAPFVDLMRENLARSLGISAGQVSVKAKSSEGLGYTGDGTGVAASAVALIETL
ncbi:MAG TPA: 2-C-methyl-D-erythritol 2,4-cyclodiphosphate synthase [Candidatus Rubrimentiphilum sp.]|nr:2-C-methyl-D-erythritol 2,4-cyclodiphosphate synthase [Candidatus Rubrimentiphilum sp.]